MVDLSHVSYQTMIDALDESKAPVIFSHSSVYALCNHTRNVRDDVLLKLKKNNGIIMINFYNGFVSCDPKNAVLSDVVGKFIYFTENEFYLLFIHSQMLNFKYDIKLNEIYLTILAKFFLSIT